jgi:hypothetical protein
MSYLDFLSRIGGYYISMSCYAFPLTRKAAFRQLSVADHSTLRLLSWSRFGGKFGLL